MKEFFNKLTLLRTMEFNLKNKPTINNTKENIDFFYKCDIALEEDNKAI